MVRVFTIVPGDRGSISGRFIPKTKKMVLDASKFYIQYYKVRIKGKWSNTGKEVVLSPTPQCSSYWKRRLRVVLNYGRPTYIYILSSSCRTANTDFPDSLAPFERLTWPHRYTHTHTNTHTYIYIWWWYLCLFSISHLVCTHFKCQTVLFDP